MVADGSRLRSSEMNQTLPLPDDAPRQAYGTRLAPQQNVYTMIRRRTVATGIETKFGCHGLRATGIKTYLQNGGKLEVAQQRAAKNLPGPPASMTAATMPSPSMKSSGWCIKKRFCALRGVSGGL